MGGSSVLKAGPEPGVNCETVCEKNLPCWPGGKDEFIGMGVNSEKGKLRNVPREWTNGD